MTQTLDALLASGRLAEARTLCEAHCKAHPDDSAAWSTLGIIHIRLGKPREAARCFRHILGRDPANAGAHYNLAKLLARAGRPDKAADHYHEAIAAHPDFPQAHYNLANLLKEEGDLEAARDHYLMALRLRPDYVRAHCNLLSLYSYNVMLPPEAMLEAHRAWDRLHGGAARARTFSHQRDGEPGQRLRIGYVSPDFRHHAVSRFFEALLAAHHREDVEVHCYAQVPRPDAVTERLRQLADGWRFIHGMDDETAARRIHADGIHVLVDLAGHTADNRLGIFTYRPAPVQATYLGYCTTTGLTTMDYWITDRWLNPPDTEERASETLYRLERCWLCYTPPREAPAPGRDGDPAPTFGSLNNLVKLTPAVVTLWSRILRAVPGSRLLLKTWQLSQPRTRRRLVRTFAEHGIGAERLILEGATPDYLESYRRMDVALDPFPRTGGATTADALWMGVPVVSLAGGRYIERQGLTLLHAVGLDELVAVDEEAYLSKAVALVRDPARLSLLRENLRPRMATSPLGDAAGLARALEDAYRDMWSRHLAGQGPAQAGA